MRRERQKAGHGKRLAMSALVAILIAAPLLLTASGNSMQGAFRDSVLLKKHAYLTGEDVEITIPKEVATLRVKSANENEKTFTYIGKRREIHYKPKGPGKYRIKAELVNGSTYDEFFIVVEKATEAKNQAENRKAKSINASGKSEEGKKYTGLPAIMPEDASIKATADEKVGSSNESVAGINTGLGTYLVGEPVVIPIKETKDKIRRVLIESGNISYSSIGPVTRNPVFYPRYEGEYLVKIKGQTKDFHTRFTVLKRNGTNEPKREVLLIVTEDGLPKEIRYKVMKRKIRSITAAMRTAGISDQTEAETQDRTNMSEDIVDIKAPLNIKGITSIELRDFIPKKNKTIRIASLQDVRELRKKIAKAFAIDPSSLEFSIGVFTFVARGTELYKCGNFTIATKKCNSRWIKVMDLVPGQEYSVEFTKNDPAYAETGVASINTRKSTHRRNETAEITIVVLDTEGYLADADVTLEVTNPIGEKTTYLTQYGTLIRAERGIYTAEYPFTEYEGNYTMVARAEGANVNSTISSYFTVNDNYPFEIIRSIPATTDPWKGPFSASITITSLQNQTAFDFSEKIPLNFTISDTGNGTITSRNSSWVIEWKNLQSPATLTYKARPPLSSPRLYTLGPSDVRYSQGVFAEARPWYLAVDPSQACPGDTTTGTYKAYLDKVTDGYKNKPGGYQPTACDISVFNYLAEMADNAASVTAGFDETALYSDGTLNADCTNKPKIKYKCDSTKAGKSETSWSHLVLNKKPSELQSLSIIVYYGVKNGKDWGGTPYWRVYAYNPDNNTVNTSLHLNFSNTQGTSSCTGQVDAGGGNCGNAAATYFQELNITPLLSGIANMSVTSIHLRIAAYDSGSNIDGMINEIEVNYTLVSPNSAPNITSNVSNTGPVNISQNITFYATCSDPDSGDTIRLIVCNASATGCNTTTPSSQIICQGTLSTSTNATCTFAPNQSQVGVHAGDKATCCDQAGLCSSTIASVYNWTVIDAKPTVTLNEPANSTTQGDATFNVTCTAADDADLANVTLYTNLSGVWKANQTLILDGNSDTLNTTYFTLINISNNTAVLWNCLAYDNTGQKSFAKNNFSFTVIYSTAPKVTLRSPPNGTTINSTSVNLNCSATDNKDIASLNLYTNRSGSFQFEQTQNFPGSNDTSVSAVFTLTGLKNRLTFRWNCKAIDNDLQESFAKKDFLVFVDQLAPAVNLTSPALKDYDLDGNATLNCSVSANRDIVNVTLYTNLTGAWAAYSTLTLSSGISSYNASFNVTGISHGARFDWNCLAYDAANLSDWGDSNHTLFIARAAKPYFSLNYDTASSWKNPQNIYGAPDGTTGDEKLDKQKYAAVYNFSGIPSTGTIISVYFSIRFAMDIAPTDDKLTLSYGLGGAPWYDLDGSAYSGANTPYSYPVTNAINQSMPISASLSLSNLQNAWFRILGVKVGGGDGVKALVDSVWLSAQISPPPTPLSVAKNASVVFENNSVKFNATWTDDLWLDCFIFSINTSGSFQNTSCIPFGSSGVSNFTATINVPPGTLVGWRFYAKDNFGVFNSTLLQTFLVSDASDSVAPQVTGLSVTPKKAKALSTFNITANITDNIGVTQALAELTFPSGIKKNFSMNNIGGPTWQYLHTGLEGGTYYVVVYGIDGASNVNVSQTTESFNVSSTITTEKSYYGRGEGVVINGFGFSANSTVNLTITRPDGTTESGFPASVSTNNDGNFTYTWTAPSSLTSILGNYSITASDSTYSRLNASTWVFVLINLDSALRYDRDNIGLDVTSLVNESDGSNSTLYVKKNQLDYFEITFQGNTQGGYSVGNLTLYVQHRDLAGKPLYVYYYDGTNYVAATCGTLPVRSSLTLDTCDLTPDIPNIPSLNNIQLHIGDSAGDGTDKQYYTDLDYVAIYMNYSIGSQMSVTINEPSDTTTILDYTDTTNNKAYANGSASLPPASQVTGTEATSTDYTSLESADDSRWQTTVTQPNGARAYQSFYFKVSQSVQDISRLVFKYEGYVTKETSLKGDNFDIYAYNYNTNTYDLIYQQNTKVTTDVTLSITISPASDYISSTGQVNTLVEGKTAINTGQPQKARADVFTDYAALQVNTIATISGTQPINVTAVDGDGVSSCLYSYLNDSGFRYSWIGLKNVSSFDFFNTSLTTAYPDGYYNISVNCTDTTGQHNDTVYVRVRVSNTPPTLFLVSPSAGANFTTANISFVWSTSDATSTPTCNLSIDGSVNASDIIANNGGNTTRNVTGISDGSHNWSVSCWNSGGAINRSETRTFDIDTAGPSVTTTSPASGAVLNTSSVTFTYTPSDAHQISNCSLILDNTINKTNTTITKGGSNSFTVTGLREGSHQWYVNCTDSFSFEGQSQTRSFTVDLTLPWVTLSYPSPGATFYGNFVQFNYTAYDNIDTSLICDIVVDGVVEDPNIASPNGTPVTRNLQIGDGVKKWNVTCTDDASWHNTSETRNFTIFGAPTVTLSSPSNGTTTNTANNTLVYYAEDGDGISGCDLYLNGVLNQSNSSGIVNGGNNNFTISLGAEGLYKWTVNCTDTTGRSTKPTAHYLYYDITPPTIILHAPVNNANFTSGNVLFNFTATDNLDTNITCNLTISGSVYDSGIYAQNGTYTTVNETGISFGTHSWNITCWDNAVNPNTSATRNFNVEGPPVPTLSSPGNNTFKPENVTFRYYISDQSGIANCSLYINGVLNQTNSSVQNSAYNNFTVYGLAEQRLNWTVGCVDLDNNEGFAQNTFILHIDTTPPTAVANYPDGQVLQNTTVVFNFTATDNNASTLSCDLYLDGTLNSSGINAVSGSDTLKEVTGLSVGAHNWNVTCQDSVGLASSSQTKSFTISLGPSVSLDSPPDNAVDSDGNLTFTYTVTSNDAIANCSLFINDKFNQTNQTAVQTGGILNNFTLYDQPQQKLNWTVKCFDVNGLSGTDTPRNLSVDLEPPNVTLTYPPNGYSISSSSVTFNFTASDSLDNELVCNMTFSDPAFNKNGINATANQPHQEQIGGFSVGTYYWNVTCTDGAFSNISQTWNFTIDIIPSITLVNPEDGATSSSSEVNFTYVPSTVASGFQYCQLILDGNSNVFNTVISNGQLNYLVNSTIPEGNHSWAVFCLDQSNYNKTSENRTITVDLTDPSVTATSPNGTLFNVASVTFNFTATDNIDTNLSCNLTINGSVTAVFAQNGTPTLYKAANLSDGLFFWNVTCFDNGLRNATSATLNFSVQEPPSVSLESPPDEKATKNRNVTFVYTPRDNSGAINNCSLILNGAINTTNTTITEGLQNNFTITEIPDGTYNWTVNCTDAAGNVGTNTTGRVLYVDTTGPSIILNEPLKGEIISSNSVVFNWTPTDNVMSTLTCNLTINGSVNRSNLNAVSDQATNVTVSGFGIGTYFWNVTCWDTLNNTNTSSTRNFTITFPDLVVTTSNIKFNDTNPSEGTVVLINATIVNTGGADAGSFVVRFYDGNPSQGGTLIGTEQTIQGIVSGSNATANVTWTAGLDLHEIWVVADYYNNITEFSKTNNNASRNITVDVWHYIVGNSSGNLEIEDTDYNLAYRWSVTNATGSNIYAADADSSVTWSQLLALAMNTSNDTRIEDFAELDDALNMENFTQTINKTYTAGSQILATQNFTVFGRTITNVPVANSTNSSLFVTGILWDSNDSSTGNYQGTEDVVFITKNNGARQGAYGTYEFEIRVPARLREYVKPNSENSVVFYVELK